VLEQSKERSKLAGTSPGAPSASLEQYLQKETPEREAQEEPIAHAPFQGGLDRFRAAASVGIVADCCHQPG
jgi:hypothetical protein